MKQHQYQTKVEWTGNEGKGTLNYKSYNRSHSISGKGKYEEILASSDPSFLGDKSRYNPEDLFLSSISSCHMLWYLHLCAVNKIVVTDYVDHAEGTMEETANGSGRFIEVTLHPQVTIVNEEHQHRAQELHAEANRMCFIANSCNFSIGHQSTITVGDPNS
jgi:organic hydroperoxide reductase OsmC/OhrA